MPISTNAPFNELGQSMVLRDIEQLYMLVEQLQGQLASDLQPGADTSASQDQSTASSATTTQHAYFLNLLQASTAVAAGASSPAFGLTDTLTTNDFAGWASAAGTFTAPAAGIYAFSAGVWGQPGAGALTGYYYAFFERGAQVVMDTMVAPNSALTLAAYRMTLSVSLRLAKGDVVSLVFQNNTSLTANCTGAFLSIALLP